MIAEFTSNTQITNVYDVVVAGGGIAGLILANDLSKTKKVLLLEAGDFEFSNRSQSFYAGEVLGDGTLYLPLDAGRVRALGGGSHIWGGDIADLEAYDFEARDYMPQSGWPIGTKELSKYHSEASAILQVEGDVNEEPVPGSQGNLIRFTRGVAKRRNVRDTFYESMRANQNIDLFINANLVNINLSESSDRVQSLSIKSYDFGKPSIQVQGGNYVLAMGAIENVRALLNSNAQSKNGVGNDRDLVGRYFMDHPWGAAATYILFHKHPDLFNALFYMKPSRAFVGAEKIGEFYCGVSPFSDEQVSSYIRSIIRTLACSTELSEDLAVRFRNNFTCAVGWLGLFIEQAPVFESWISLGAAKDEFGNRRVQLDWNVSDLDRRTLRRSLFEVGKYMAANDVGRVRLSQYVMEDKTVLRKHLLGGHHHLGGLRMAKSADEGVLDRNCKVFGVSNLFVAGSAVFPTGGAANPTFTIIKLALRLSDYLSGRN